MDTQSSQNEVSAFRPLVALRALRDIANDPDDTTAAIRVIDALPGPSFQKMLDRMQKDPMGREILSRKKSLFDVLADRESLRQLPEQSLGRAYLDFVEREQISAEGLEELRTAVQAERADNGSPDAVLNDRLYSMHDLFHVVTGYGRDIVGETLILAFTFAQTGSLGSGLIVGFTFLMTYLRFPEFLGKPKFVENLPEELQNPEFGAELRRYIGEAYRLGRECDWIVGADWENLLEVPLSEVRKRFSMVPPEAYRSVRSLGAPPVQAEAQ